MFHFMFVQYTFSSVWLAEWPPFLPGVYETVIYTAVIQEPNRLYTLLPGVYTKSLFTRQPFKSQIGYIHCCRVYT